MHKCFKLLTCLLSIYLTASCIAPAIDQKLSIHVMTNIAPYDLNQQTAIFNPRYSYQQEINLHISSYCLWDAEYLSQLRSVHSLDQLVETCTTDLDKVQVVARWVTNLWEHDGSNYPQKSDPLFILDQVINHNQRFRCVEYAAVIAGCLNALQIPARTVGLKTEDMETRLTGAGHVAVEAFLQEQDKWIFIDGQCGVIPILDGIPLNAVEFAAALNPELRGDGNLELVLLNDDFLGDEAIDAYFEFVTQYLYYMDVNYLEIYANNSVRMQKVMLMPIGAERPTKFQGQAMSNISLYTHSAVDFYQTAITP